MKSLSEFPQFYEEKGNDITLIKKQGNYKLPSINAKIRNNTLSKCKIYYIIKFSYKS